MSTSGNLLENTRRLQRTPTPVIFPVIYIVCVNSAVIIQQSATPTGIALVLRSCSPAMSSWEKSRYTITLTSNVTIFYFWSHFCSSLHLLQEYPKNKTDGTLLREPPGYDSVKVSIGLSVAMQHFNPLRARDLPLPYMIVWQ